MKSGVDQLKVSADRGEVKVLFITSDASAVAGVGPCLADTLEYLDRKAIDPVVICPWEGRQAATILPRLEALGFPLFTRDLGKWLPSPNIWGGRHLSRFVRGLKNRVWSLASLIEREHIDLVYSNGLPCIDGALAARLTGRPHIWHLHEAVRANPDLRSYLPARLVEELVARLSDAIIVNSAYLAREFRATERRTALRVIHNGVDVSRFTHSLTNGGRENIRQELDLTPDTSIVLAVGTVNPRKSYETLIQAAVRVLATQPKTCFLVVGSELPEYTRSLRELAVDLGLGSAFRFLGPRSDIPQLMTAADIFVHSARQETFGRVLVEAMAAAKPVIATRCGGPEEIVVDGETGYLIAVDAPESMAERLKELLSSPEPRGRFGQAGRCLATEKFSVERYAEEVQALILEVAKRRQRA
jgi:glycosyltransferase involved in cell wall biosynthesis